MTFKKIAILIIISISFSTFSQTEKGTFFIGASNSLFDFKKKISEPLFFNQVDYEDKFKISPTLGFFIYDKLLVGIDFSYEQFTGNIFGSEENANTTEIGPFIKYYFLETKLKPFSTLSYLVKKWSPNFGSNEESLQTLNINIGCAYFFSKNISLEFSIAYEREYITNFSRKIEFISSSIGFGIFI